MISRILFLQDHNIIVMMYDDIAENKYNPEKGVIINRPNGNNVYLGVPKDYNNHTGMKCALIKYDYFTLHTSYLGQ